MPAWGVLGLAEEGKLLARVARLPGPWEPSEGGAGPSMGLGSRCGSITSATAQRPGGAWTRVDVAWGAVTDTL